MEPHTLINTEGIGVKRESGLEGFHCITNLEMLNGNLHRCG